MEAKKEIVAIEEMIIALEKVLEAVIDLEKSERELVFIWVAHYYAEKNKQNPNIGTGTHGPHGTTWRKDN